MRSRPSPHCWHRGTHRERDIVTNVPLPSYMQSGRPLAHQQPILLQRKLVRLDPALLSTTRSRQSARGCHLAVHQRMELRQGDLMAAMHEPIGAPETQPIPRNELHLLGTPGWSGRHPSRFPRSNLASRLAGQCDANLEGEPWVPALCVHGPPTSPERRAC